MCRAILMASRQLARAATGFDDYAKVDRLLTQAERPVIMHWLGTAFDPALEATNNADVIATATASFLDLITTPADKVSSRQGLAARRRSREGSACRLLPRVSGSTPAMTSTIAS